tara:strand:+ start:120 stop:314 length:195 start_codon:yes stop_codon:yes gene_type:complete
MTTLQQLDDAHENQAAAIVRKQLDNMHWKINPNDIGWMFHYPQVDTQLGRSKRVFYQLLQLQEK